MVDSKFGQSPLNDLADRIMQTSIQNGMSSPGKDVLETAVMKMDEEDKDKTKTVLSPNKVSPNFLENRDISATIETERDVSSRLDVRDESTNQDRCEEERRMQTDTSHSFKNHDNTSDMCLIHSTDFSAGLEDKPVRNVSSSSPKVLKLIKGNQWEEINKLVSKNPDIIVQCVKDQNHKTILHILLSQPSTVEVPSTLVSKIVNLKPEVVGMGDDDKNLPLHYAVKTLKGLKIIDLLVQSFKASTGIKNSSGNLALHYAVQNVNEPRYDLHTCGVGLLTTNYPKAVLESDELGRTPLHYACMGSKNNANENKAKISYDLVVHLISIHNQLQSRPCRKDFEGNAPLHIAVTRYAPFEIIEAFTKQNLKSLSVKLFMQLNKNGDLPLHIAIKRLAEKKESSYFPCCHKTIAVIIKAAPQASIVRTSSGALPIHIATENNLPSPVIKALLVLDIPITPEKLKLTSPIYDNSFTALSSTYVKEITQRKHHNSWWHIAVDCNDKYIHIIEELLANCLSHQQIIILARHLGGEDSNTRVIDAVSDECKALFSQYLRLHNRYELLPLATPSGNMKDVKEYHALDHGICFEDAISDDNDNKSTLFDKYDDAESSDPYSDNSEVYMTSSGVEVRNIRNPSLYEVVLRCFLYEEEFLAEINVRGQLRLSLVYVEEIYRYHYEKTYVDKTLSYIVFEKPDHTLENVFYKMSIGAKTQKWISKCCIVLGQIAAAIHHLHSKGVVHGHLDPSNIAKYGNMWKLTNIGKVTPIGDAMRGPVRHCVPPESIMSLTNAHDIYITETSTPSHKRSNSSDTKSTWFEIPRVKFSNYNRVRITSPFASKYSSLDDIRRSPMELTHSAILANMDDCDSVFGYEDEEESTHHGDETVTRDNSYKSLKKVQLQCETDLSLKYCDNGFSPTRKLRKVRSRSMRGLGKNKCAAEIDYGNALLFTPERCNAQPSWDAWSFGLVMVQLLTGRCVHLPNFEKAEDALLRNLSTYDKAKMKKIRDHVRKTVGDSAADLVSKLLHPETKHRICSFGQVLEHEYFLEGLASPVSPRNDVWEENIPPSSSTCNQEE